MRSDAMENSKDKIAYLKEIDFISHLEELMFYYEKSLRTKQENSLKNRNLF